jgi:hypothetical protein
VGQHPCLFGPSSPRFVSACTTAQPANTVIFNKHIISLHTSALIISIVVCQNIFFSEIVLNINKATNTTS